MNPIESPSMSELPIEIKHHIFRLRFSLMMNDLIKLKNHHKKNHKYFVKATQRLITVVDRGNEYQHELRETIKGYTNINYRMYEDGTNNNPYSIKGIKGVGKKMFDKIYSRFNDASEKYKKIGNFEREQYQCALSKLPKNIKLLVRIDDDINM